MTLNCSCLILSGSFPQFGPRFCLSFLFKFCFFSFYLLLSRLALASVPTWPFCADGTLNTTHSLTLPQFCLSPLFKFCFFSTYLLLSRLARASVPTWTLCFDGTLNTNSLTHSLLQMNVSGRLQNRHYSLLVNFNISSHSQSPWLYFLFSFIPSLLLCGLSMAFLDIIGNMYGFTGR